MSSDSRSKNSKALSTSPRSRFAATNTCGRGGQGQHVDLVTDLS